MATVLMSGFETNSLTQECNATTGSPTIGTTHVRTGTYAGRISTLVSATRMGFQWKWSGATNGPGFFASHIYVVTLPSAENTILYSAGTASFSAAFGWRVTVDNKGQLRLYSDAGVVGSASFSISPNVWNALEVHFDKTQAGGSQQLDARCNGVQWASSTTLTYTNQGGFFNIGGNLNAEAQTAGEWWFDDIIVNDNTGSFQTTYVGPTPKLYPLWANGAGVSNQFVGSGVNDQTGASASVNNWKNVGSFQDKPTSDSASSILSSNTLNNLDVFTIEAPTWGTSDTINAVGAMIWIAGAGASANASYRARIYDVASTGANFTASAANIAPLNATFMMNLGGAATGTQSPAAVSYQVPGTANAWTKTTLSLAGLGYTLAATNTNGVQVSGAFVYVSVSPFAPYGAVTTAAMNTTSTNDMSADGFTWADINAFTVDKFGNFIVIDQRNNAGTHVNIFIYSNNQGTTWTDDLSESFLNRGSIAYDSVNDVVHVLWIGTDFTSSEGIIYRRYTINRSGNNITSFTKDATVNLQLDFQQNSATMTGDFPKLLFLNDAAFGTYGALLAIWSVTNTAAAGGAIVGNEYRASMVTLGSDATHGKTAGNWVAPTGSGDTTILGTGTAPQVAYNRLAGAANASNNVCGSFAYLRKSANHNKNDIYFFYYDPNAAAADGQWSYRRLQWNSSNNNWSTGLTAAQVLGQMKRSGTDTGYSLKYQLISQCNEETINDLVYVAAPSWASNVLGDTWSYCWVVGSTDVPNAFVDLYSANQAHIYAPTGDLSVDTASADVIVTLDVSGSTDQNYGFYYVVKQSTIVQEPTLIYNTHGVDIPLCLTNRVNVSGTNKMMGAFRNTLNTPTPPYTGFFYSLTTTAVAAVAGAPNQSLILHGVGT